MTNNQFLFFFLSGAGIIVFLLWRRDVFANWRLPDVGEIFLDLRDLYRRLLGRPLPLPTPQETQRAIFFMQTVRSHIDDFFNSDDIKRRPLYQHCHFRVQTLTKAAKLLKSARRLDPNAVLVDEKDKDLKWTQDRLAWELLYWQSEAYYIEGQNAVAIHNLHFSELAAEGIVSTSTYKDAASKERTSYDNAIKAAERTLKYFPDNALSLIQLAKILHARGNRWRARGVMKRARKIHPDDMDVLKASQE